MIKQTRIKDRIIDEIHEFVKRSKIDSGTTTRWKKPIVGFADAKDPLFAVLKRVISTEHLLPRDLLPTAKTVIAFFIPFERQVAISNITGTLASEQWAIAYVETNRLIAAICEHMQGSLESDNYHVETIPATHNFDMAKLVSNWSHRHIGYIAGLGKFGVNNMIITERGCCGRIGSFVTDLDLDADRRSQKEACLYRHDASCLKCVDRCVNTALFEDRFDRFRCYDMCLRNEKQFNDLGTADVCGKCLVGLPCTFRNPVKRQTTIV
jgi:epoxyqueuosine reductase QueG